MAEQSEVPELGPTSSSDYTHVERGERAARVRSTGHWFYWLAGLSLINSIIVYAGGQWSFLFGLGLTQVVDAILVAAMDEGLRTLGIAVALCINLMIALLFCFFGLHAARGKAWAFVVGGLLYLGDALLLLWVQDYLSLAFHVWVLFQLGRGLQAVREGA